MKRVGGLRFLQTAALVLVGLVVLVQFVPYGRNHQNPPVVREPTWGSSEVRALAVRACFDCHSNEPVWPWYSNIAPVSWVVQHHVEEGRSKLNFSDWAGAREADEITETISRGSMPPTYYTLMHPEAKLSDTERQTLISGLQALGSGN